MQPDASSQRKMPFQQRTYQILLSVFILFTKMCYSPLLLTTVSFFSLPLCPKSWINPCWVTQDLWWFIISTGFAQPSHQWDPRNANPTCTSFPLRHLCLLHLPHLFCRDSFLPHNLLKDLCTFSLFLTSYECVKTREWAHKAMGKVFLKCTVFSPFSALRWVSADLSEMQAKYSSSWPFYLFSRQ